MPLRIPFKISNVVRLSLLFGLVWLSLGMAAYYGWRRASAEVAQRAQAEAGFAVAAASQRLAQADRLFAPKARAQVAALRTAATRVGAPRLVQGQGGPNLTFGRGTASKPVAAHVATDDGGAAAVMVLSGEAFSPVDSSLATTAGVGPGSPYLKPLRAGRSAEGPIRLGGHAYYASFLPITGAAGRTIGAYAGFYPLEGLDEITRELANSPVFTHGFLVAADSRDGVGFSAPGAPPPWLATHLKEINQGDEIEGAVMDGYAVTRSPQGKSGLRVIAGVSQGDVAFSTMKLVGASLTFLAFVIVVALCLAWLLARRLTDALAQAEQSRIEAEAARAQAEAAQAALNGELEQAARYVQSLLPAPTRQGPVTANWLYQPSAGLGGDAFGYHWLDDNRFAFYLLDVCGHGVGAALLATTVMNVIRAQTVQADFADPASVLAALNGAFPMARQNDMYFTMWYGVYDAQTQQVRYAGGGHHAAVLIDGGGVAWLLQGKGAAIGCFPGVQYPVFDVDAPAGARLYVFSDGLFEVERKHATDMLTFNEFVGIIVGWRREHADRELSYLLETVQEIQGKATFDDDCSLVEVSFRHTGQVRLVA